MPLPQRWYSNTAKAKISFISHSDTETKKGEKSKKTQPTNQQNLRKKQTMKYPKPPQLSTTRKTADRTL